MGPLSSSKSKKRSASTPAAPQRDFAKRPRAKVGKRAPTKANATDTSFKTASVAVRPQRHGAGGGGGVDGESAPTDEPLSSRGNALSTLRAGMRHHAPAVRRSALRGMRDAVQSLGERRQRDKSGGVTSSASAILEAHIPSLVSSACRSWLDEDDDARSLGVGLFGDVLAALAPSIVPSSLSSLANLVPFVPLLCAHASSALNSLDRATRRDGAIITGMLASSSPSSGTTSGSSGGGIATDMGREVGKYADTLLPSFARLLGSTPAVARPTAVATGPSVSGGNDATSSSSAAAAGRGAGKKRKRGSGGGGNAAVAPVPAAQTCAGADAALRSLVLLLRAADATASPPLSDFSSGAPSDVTNSGCFDFGGDGRSLTPLPTCAKPNLSFLPGGSGRRNTLLMLRRDQSARAESSDLAAVYRGGGVRETADNKDQKGKDNDANDCGGGSSGDKPHVVMTSSDAASGLERLITATSLLEALRGIFVEVLQSGRTIPGNGNGGGGGALSIVRCDLERLDDVVRAVRLVHLRCGQAAAAMAGPVSLRRKSGRRVSNRKKHQGSGKRDDSDVAEDYLAAARGALSLFLEAFPVIPLDRASSSPSDEDEQRTRYEQSNAGLCAALAELGGGGSKIEKDAMAGEGTSEGKGTPEWVDAVLAYVLPRLAQSNDDDDEGAIEADDEEKTDDATATSTLLRVVRTLLLPSGIGDDDVSQRRYYLLGSPFMRLRLLEAFGEAFFPRIPSPNSSLMGSKDVSSRIYAASSVVVAAAAEIRTRRLAPTAAGRTAAALLVALIAEEQGCDAENDRSPLLLRMASVLPIYLGAWGGRFPAETGTVLATLSSMVRRWSPPSIDPDRGPPRDLETSDEDERNRILLLDELCAGLRFSLEVLFVPSRTIVTGNENGAENRGVSKKKRKKQRKVDPLVPNTVLEHLPEHIQRLAVGIVGMLKSPTETTVLSFANLCSRSFAHKARVRSNAHVTVAATLSPDATNFVMEVMHSCRKTMMMGTYLTFLFNSVGIEHARGIGWSSDEGGAGTEKVALQLRPDSLFSYDEATAQLVRFLTTCCDGASKKVFPMIRPLLESWLRLSDDRSVGGAEHSTNGVEKKAKVGSNADATGASDALLKQMIRARAAISVVAAFAWDEVTTDVAVGSGETGGGYLELDDAFDNLLIKALCDLCETYDRICGSTHEQQDTLNDDFHWRRCLARLWGPASILLRHRDGMMRQFLNEILKRVCGGASETCTTGSYIKSLLLILKSKEPVLMSTLVKGDKELQELLVSITVDIEKVVTGTHSDRLGAKLKYQVEQLVDIKPSCQEAKQ